MKPYVICHMASSVDGRILPKRWRPHGIEGDLYERIHAEFAGQARLIGRITGQEFAKAEKPAVDGAAGAPCVFDSTPAEADRSSPVRAMQLIGSESKEGGAAWLRYRLENNVEQGQ